MKIIAGFSDEDFFENISNSLSEIKIDHNHSSGVSLLNKIMIGGYSIIILGDKLTDMTAYEFIYKLMREKPTPCLVIYKDGAEKANIDYPNALDYGIVATLELTFKNGHIRFPNLIQVRLNVLSKLRVDRFTTQIEQLNRGKRKMSYHDPKLRDKIRRIRENTTLKHIKSNVNANSTVKTASGTPKQMIVIGASTGGPKTLMYIISQFPTNFPPVMVVQHMPKGFVKSFADRMDSNANMRVVLGKDGDLIRNGTVYIAPGGYHMEISGNSPSNARIQISDGAKVNFVKPAVDVTLYAAARIYSSRVISVILTGMGADGRNGTRLVKKLGGRSIALNEEQSIIYGMNKAVIDAGLADEILGMDQIVTRLASWVAN